VALAAIAREARVAAPSALDLAGAIGRDPVRATVHARRAGNGRTVATDRRATVATGREALARRVTAQIVRVAIGPAAATVDRNGVRRDVAQGE
jgi:hypothetical protein